MGAGASTPGAPSAARRVGAVAIPEGKFLTLDLAQRVYSQQGDEMESSEVRIGQLAALTGVSLDQRDQYRHCDGCSWSQAIGGNAVSHWQLH